MPRNFNRAEHCEVIMICKRCKKDQDISNFYKSNRTTSGYRGTCKTCCSEQALARYEKTKTFVGHNQQNLPIPSQEWLKENYDYHEDGGFIRNIPRGNQKAGSVFFGKKEKTGYMRVAINYDVFVVHRVIWKWHNGDEPKFIDHINGNRSDNRIENLRACSKSENRHNSDMNKNNTSGYNGVAYYDYGKTPKWVWHFIVDGIRYSGYCSSMKSAVLAYCSKAEEINPVFMRKRIDENMDKLKADGLI